MSDPLQQIAFAKLAGVKRQNINNLIRSGTLEANEEGLLDPKSPKNALYLLKSSDAAKNSKDQTRKNEPGHADTLSAATLRHKIGQADKLDIENNAKINLLIQRDLLSRVFAKIHMIDETMFKNLGQNCAPNIMAIGGITDDGKQIEIQSEIDNAVYRILESAKKQLDDFLLDLPIKENN